MSLENLFERRDNVYCLNCGNEISTDAKFCPKCGAQNMANGSVTNSVRNDNSSKMDVKATSVVAYMTWIGFIVSICAGDRDGAKFYINQALVFHIFSLLLRIISSLDIFSCFFMNICHIYSLFLGLRNSVAKSAAYKRDFS